MPEPWKPRRPYVPLVSNPPPTSPHSYYQKKSLKATESNI